jgi:hypothetical protein
VNSYFAFIYTDTNEPAFKSGRVVGPTIVEAKPLLPAMVAFVALPA